MPVERRGRVIAVWDRVNRQREEPDFNGRRQPSCGGTSRMTRECQVRICERLGVKFPGPTRHLHGITAPQHCMAASPQSADMKNVAAPPEIPLVQWMDGTFFDGFNRVSAGIFSAVIAGVAPVVLSLGADSLIARLLPGGSIRVAQNDRQPVSAGADNHDLRVGRLRKLKCRPRCPATAGRSRRCPG